MNFAIYKRFIIWWVSVLLVGTSMFWATYFGVAQTIWNVDITHITSIILALYIASNLSLGWLAWKASDPFFVRINRNILEKITDYNWFMSEILLALGMFGTVIGLIHMLSGIDMGANKDSAAVASIVVNMIGSLGLALYTNVVGLLFSIILKLQTYFIGVEARHAQKV